MAVAAAACIRGQEAMGHLTPSRDHFWMRLDVATLTGRFLAAGAALCRPAEPDHRLLCFLGDRRKERSDSLSLSLSLVDDKWVQQNSGSHMSD
jgi:hypothetical protein